MAVPQQQLQGHSNLGQKITLMPTLPALCQGWYKPPYQPCTSNLALAMELMAYNSVARVQKS